MKEEVKATYSAFTVVNDRKLYLKSIGINKYGMFADNIEDAYFTKDIKHVRDLARKLPFDEVVIIRRLDLIKSKIENFVTVMKGSNVL